MCAPCGKRGAKPKMHMKMCDAGSMVSGGLKLGKELGFAKASQSKSKPNEIKYSHPTP